MLYIIYGIETVYSIGTQVQSQKSKSAKFRDKSKKLRNTLMKFNEIASSVNYLLLERHKNKNFYFNCLVFKRNLFNVWKFRRWAPQTCDMHCNKRFSLFWVSIIIIRSKRRSFFYLVIVLVVTFTVGCKTFVTNEHSCTIKTIK